MSNKPPTDNDLKEMLFPRSIPPHDDQLARRITAAAARTPQREALWQCVSNMFEEFKIPAPAFSMAAIIILGFSAGLGTFGDIGNTLFTDSAATSTIEFLLEEDTLL